MMRSFSPACPVREGGARATAPTWPPSARALKLPCGPPQPPGVEEGCFVTAGLMARGASLVAADASIGAGFEQRSSRVGVAEIDGGGVHERRETEVVHRVDPNMCLDQSRNDGGAVGDYRPV